MLRRLFRWTLCLGVATLATARSANSQVLGQGRSGDVALAGPVEPVFLNGAWDHGDALNPRNAYISALLAKDIYYQHGGWDLDVRDNDDSTDGGGAVNSGRQAGARAGRSDRRLSKKTVHGGKQSAGGGAGTPAVDGFCGAMQLLGADSCDIFDGASDLVWAVVGAGPRSALLVFRGSNTPQNWISDLKSFHTTNVADFGGGAAGANVAAGFYKIFVANKHSIMDRVQQAMAPPPQQQGAGSGASGGVADDGAGPRQLFIVGHSLGGAIALMAAAYLDTQLGIHAAGVYTFGCPMIGDASWAKVYGPRDVTQRYENSGDIVPTLPFGLTWRHVGISRPVAACSGPLLAALAGAAQQQQQHHSAGNGGSIGRSGKRGRSQLRSAEASALALAQSTWAAVEGVGEGAGSSAVAGGAGSPQLQVQVQLQLGIRDHMIGTYQRVVFSCLSYDDQRRLPDPDNDDE